MDVNALLQALGYLNSTRRWVTLENADPRLSHYYRLAQRAGGKVKDGAAVVGSYVYTTSREDQVTPPRPAVFVAYADNDPQARTIHRHFWNMGDCPFVIVVLPGSIRVYTGFDYTDNDPGRGRIVEEPLSLLDEELPESLKSFHADAIDSGRIWAQQAKRLTSDTRVDYRLLNNLKELSQQLQKNYGLERPVTHALIGKYIYFRYLRDRDILDDDWLAMKNIRREDVFGRDATAKGFETLSAALQSQFNGAIFPLPSDDNRIWRTNGAIRFLAATFHGDTFEGQLVLDFGAYDFSYIPVELLSSVYEQFLKAEGKGEGDGVVYTPEALADYVLAEMQAVNPLEQNHKVLDPCCGSGVFLVLAYRRLIEQLWREQGKRPSAETLKRLLQNNIFGVEKDREACDITVFSLILTLLSHLEPPELRANVDFEFPILIGENIHQSDFFDSNSPVFRENMRFNWIVGNPPWTAADKRNPKHDLALAWMREAATKGRVVGGRRLDEAFTWRAADLLEENGCAGLLVKATTLVNSSSSAYRKAFFKQQKVRRVSNLSNLRYILFMGPEGQRAKAPCASLIYEKGISDEDKPSILHFGPFVADQLPLRTRGGQRRVWTIALYESDIQQIDYNDAVKDVPYLWKTALWGSFQDRRALRRLKKVLPRTLGEVIAESKWVFGTGPHVKAKNSKSKGTFVSVEALAGKSILDTSHLDTLFFVPAKSLMLLPPERQFIRQRGGEATLDLMFAPHIVISATRAVYSDRDFVIPAPKVGIAATDKDADYLKAIALYINSSVAHYAHFFSNAPWGISIAIVNPENVKSIPFIDLSPQQVEKLSTAYDKFMEQERAYITEHAGRRGTSLDLQSEVDAVVGDTLRIPKDVSAIAQDFMRVRYQLLEGKPGDTARKPPSTADLQLYAEELRDIVDAFARRHHCVSILAGAEAIVATIEVTNASEPLPVEILQRWNTTARHILNAANEQHSQWAYIQRSVRIFDGPRAHIVKAARLLDWTRTQAVQDAADLVAEVLHKTTPHYEQATT